MRRSIIGCVWRVFALLFVLLACVCFFLKRKHHIRTHHSHKKSSVLVTGYCNCGQCCGWKLNWFGLGQPVYDYGPMKGKPKKIGITAIGKRAKKGTIAADPRIFKFGTRLFVPGYGIGTVEDVGGSIKGHHIDVWFPSHDEAREWGARWLQVSPVE